MESKEGLIAGVTVIAQEAPSNYQVAPRVETSAQATITPPFALSMPSAGMVGSFEKKKRGRPRKYVPDSAMGTPGTILSPSPIFATPLPASGDFSDMKQRTQPASGGLSSDKNSKVRYNGLDSNPKQKKGTENLGEMPGCTSGISFTPHVLTVKPGEDVSMKIIALSQEGPRAICIMCASGLISNVTIRQTDSSGGTLTYEGRFQILSLTGSFTPAEVGGSRVGRSGGMSISLSSPDGRIVGGILAGFLIAASPVQVIIGSFLPLGHLEPKQKKQKRAAKPMTQPVGMATPYHNNAEHPIFDAHNQSHPEEGNGNVLVASDMHSDDWDNMTLELDGRRSATDINIPLQQGE